ncbi:tRNA 2-selenouridine synthase-like [Mercenaria mercenaria]|uniref:tRNA 2-selenouridine synthase-like n=1 Tax=Mercenaria mercenaria TaxID=6596 RepID=UPI00234F4AB9|nr:tRNA 2-selenouridine synthase-like [Mercenaria mercenaria]XP_053394642.1 tRNA 2-selenouridine synthase-like [Mercenaria mercenaria]XP_053394643.1 tRNA 2-selenouridine synthase-like [Mercenaria mercenaria]
MASKILQKYPLFRLAYLQKYCTAVKATKSSVPEVLTSHRDGRVSEIIDVRTPAEFEEDHIPGAINLPVLTNDERVTVGKQYSLNQFEARKTGAAVISRNIARHIDDYFQSQKAEYRPLIYCWRGGQRSYSMALVLAQIGFQTFVLDKGYKQYRAVVRQELENLPEKFQFKVISGLTGSGKTKILQTLASQGHQVLDLEALAKHKGSVLGLWHGETQPSQKYFDSLLCDKLHTFTTSRPVWLESESVRIGTIHIPQKFFKRLQAAPRFCVHLPIEERVNHIIKDYPNWIEHTEDLKLIIQKLVKVAGHERVNDWLALIDKGQWKDFVRKILLEHYDPTYLLSQKKNNRSSLETEYLKIENLDDETLINLVDMLGNS